MIAGRQTDPGSSNRAALLATGGEVRPVGDLENRGIAQVRLISQSQFDTAVREALAREVIALADGLPLDSADRERLLERAHARLAGKPIQDTLDIPIAPKVEAPTTIAPEPIEPSLTDELPIASRTAPELEPLSLEEPSFIEPETIEAPPVVEPTAPARTEAAEIDVEALENRIVEEVGRLVSQNWREELRSAQDSQRNQIDRLEGRIDSLMKALDQIERLMDHQHTRPEEGMPTSFIDTGALGGIKNELMEQLFEANLALRELEAGEEG